jgi:hypothetical protein
VARRGRRTLPDARDHQGLRPGAADRGGEQDELRRSHARYFTQLAETSGYYLLCSQQLEWLRRLAGALGWYWWLRSMKVEGAELAAAVPDPDDPILRLIGPLGALFRGFVTGQVALQPALFDDAVADPEPWVSATALVMRGHVRVNYGRQHARAEEDFLAATGIFTALEGWRGEHAAAAGHYRQAIGLAVELGSAEDEITFRLFLTRELWLLGDREVAHAEPDRAQRDAERLRLPEVIALGDYTAGDLARPEGRPDDARAALRRAVEQGAPPDIAQQLRALAATGLGTCRPPTATWRRPAAGTPRPWIPPGRPPTRR